MIHVRKLRARGLRRRRYEVVFTDAAGNEESRHITGRPVTLIDPEIGVAEAWSVVRAADREQQTGGRQWIHFPPGAPLRAEASPNSKEATRGTDGA